MENIFQNKIAAISSSPPTPSYANHPSVSAVLFVFSPPSYLPHTHPRQSVKFNQPKQTNINAQRNDWHPPQRRSISTIGWLLCDFLYIQPTLLCLSTDFYCYSRVHFWREQSVGGLVLHALRLGGDLQPPNIYRWHVWWGVMFYVSS